MTGSKYSDEQREQFRALLLTGMSASAAAREMGLPVSTACCWAQRMEDESDDYAHERELEKRKLVRKCMKVYGDSIAVMEQRIAAAAADQQRIEDGLKVIRKAARDGMIGLAVEDVEMIKKLIGGYTGIKLRDLAATVKAMGEEQEKLEGSLGMGDSGAVQISFADGIGDLAG